MATKPVHTPSIAPVATVRIQAYWGNLHRDSITCGQHDALKQLQRLVADRSKADPTPERVSFLVEQRSYIRAKDSYTPWKPTARYNHLGLEIAL
jgi:hypothetical protein